MLQNVVTYTIRVDVNNDSGKLLPFLTANAQFKIGQREGVLLVPNAALHWSPQPNQVVREPDPASSGLAGAPGRDRRADSDSVSTPKVSGTIWIEQGKFVRPFQVNVGLTDGTSTEVEGKDLREGMPVVVGEAGREPAASANAERSPFTPQIGRGFRQGQGSQNSASGAAGSR
jgi:HlyD family secretion protein